MHTDGTVTDLIQLLVQDKVKVVKISEVESQNDSQRILKRRIHLQGCRTGINWIYAESDIYLDNLSGDFVSDLVNHSIPIGALWSKYRLETFKQLITQIEEKSKGISESGFPEGTPLLTREYHVFNINKLIMKITEKFPIHKFVDLLHE